MQRAGRAMAPLRIDAGARFPGEASRQRRVVHVRVADEYVAHLAPGDGRAEGRVMALVVRAGIDHGDALCPPRM